MNLRHKPTPVVRNRPPKPLENQAIFILRTTCQCFKPTKHLHPVQSSCRWKS